MFLRMMMHTLFLKSSLLFLPSLLNASLPCTVVGSFTSACHGSDGEHFDIDILVGHLVTNPTPFGNGIPVMLYDHHFDYHMIM